MLSYGDKMDFGLTLPEVIDYLQKPIPRMKNRNVLQCLDSDGERFLQKIKDHLADSKR